MNDEEIREDERKKFSCRICESTNPGMPTCKHMEEIQKLRDALADLISSIELSTTWHEIILSKERAKKALDETEENKPIKCQHPNIEKIYQDTGHYYRCPVCHGVYTLEEMEGEE